MTGRIIRTLLIWLCLSICSISAELPGEVKVLLRDWKPGGDNQRIIELLNDLVDRNDETARAMFRKEIELAAAKPGVAPSDVKKTVEEVLTGISNYEMDLSTSLAIQVAKNHNVEAVIRTGSSGDRFMNWKGKREDSGRFDIGNSDDDISFLGPEGEAAAREFNELKASRKLGKSRCSGFGLSPITDATSYDLLVKQIQNPNAFAGAAGYGGIKKEIVEKGGAVIGVRQGDEMVEAAEKVADYIARNKGSTLAEVMDVAKIAAELREFGPLTMYASCARQMAHNPSDRETVKYLLRVYAAMEASGALQEAAGLGSRHQPGYFKTAGNLLANAYADKSGKAATKLLSEINVGKFQVDAWEAVMLSTSHKLGEMIARAEAEAGEGAVNIANNPELRRMIHEMAAGFSLLQTMEEAGGISHGDILNDVIPAILNCLNAKGARREMLYKSLYTSFFDAGTLAAAAAEETAGKVVDNWVAAGNPLRLTRRMKDFGPNGAKERQLLLGIAENRMQNLKAGESVKNLQKLLENPKADSFLWRMLASETGQKFVTESIAMAPFILMTMYSEYQNGQMKDLSDAAFVLIDFPPGGMTVKKALIEGMNREVVFLFIKDGLYFTPTWPLVLAGDTISMSWTITDTMRLQNENEGIVDILVFNGEFDDNGGKYTFKNLKLPDGPLVAPEGMQEWLFTTKYVKVKHSLEGLEYRINDLSEKSWHLFNGFYVANDPALQQMRAAIDQQLSGINWDEAGKFFKEDASIGMAAAGYLLWMAGVEHIKTSGRNEGWAKLYERLKDQFEKRKDTLQKDIMVPQLIALAEAKRATLNAENEYAPKLDALQKQLEALRTSPLGVSLTNEVDMRAKLLANKNDSVIFGSTQTKSDKKFTRGEYWQAAYAAYLRIYDISKEVPANVKRLTGYERSEILRFTWTGDYIDDLRKAEQSCRGFANAIFKSRTDIQRIKGVPPDPADSIDVQAFDLLGSVLFPWRMALDQSDKDQPNAGDDFFKEYEDALEKVKLLYQRCKEFTNLLQKGSRLAVSPHPVPLGKAADVELQLMDSSLLKFQAENNLIVTWSVKPSGEITGEKKGFKSRLAVYSPAPLVLTADVEKLGQNATKGYVRKLVQVVLPDDFIELTMSPRNPVAGGAFTVKAEIPERFYGKDSDQFEFRWSGENCAVVGSGNRTGSGKAGLKEGQGRVTVELWVANELGERANVGRKTIDFKIIKDGDGGTKANANDGQAIQVNDKPGNSKDAGNNGRRESQPGGGAPANTPPTDTKGAGVGAPQDDKVNSELIAAAYAAGRAAAAAVKKEMEFWKKDMYGKYRMPTPRYARNPILTAAYQRGYDDAWSGKSNVPPKQGDLRNPVKPLTANTYTAANTATGDEAVQNWIKLAYSDGTYLGSVANGASVRTYRSQNKMPDPVYSDPMIPPQYAADPMLTQAFLRGYRDGWNMRKYSIPTEKELGGGEVAARVQIKVIPQQSKLKLGESVQLQSIINNLQASEKPVNYKWTGDVSGKGEHVGFTATKPGTITISVSVTGAKGPIGSAKVTFEVGDVEVTVSGAPVGPVVIGAPVKLMANVTTGGKPAEGKYVIRWEPYPEAQFVPFESDNSRNTTVKFMKLGKVRVWAVVLAKEGALLKTLAESPQVAIEVVEPKLTLTVSPETPQVGQEVKLTVKDEPAVPDDLISFWWEIKGDALNAGPLQNGRDYTFTTKGLHPVTVTVHGKGRKDGSNLGEDSKTISPQSYTVQVTGPKRLGPPPMIWSERAMGLIEAPSAAIGTFQDVTMGATINPVPPGQILRYKWSITPDGCSLSSPASRETRANASSKGTYQVTVQISNNDGVVLGAGSGSISVTVSQDDQKPGKGSELPPAAGKEIGKQKEPNKQAESDNDEKAQRLVNEGYAFEKQGKYEAAIDKFKQALSHVKNAGLIKHVTELETKLGNMNNAQKLVNDGYALEKQGKTTAAIDKFKQAQALTPDAGLLKHIRDLEGTLKKTAPPETTQKPATGTKPVGKSARQEPDQRNVTGIYVCSQKSENTTMTLTLDLKQFGNKLSGTMHMAPAPPGGAGGPVGGTIDGNAIMLAVTTSAESMATPMRITVSPDGQTLTMTMTVDGETNTLVFRKK